MDATHDPEANAAYIRFSDAAPAEASEVAPGVVLDLTADGKVVGVEILNASATLAAGAWKSWPAPGEG